MVSNWRKIIKEIIRDIAIAFLVSGATISIPAAIQQKATLDFDKFFGMIEMGVYEWIALFLFSIALLLYFKRKQVGKYLDELTGKAKGEREHRKQLELREIEFKEKLDLDNRKRIERQAREAEQERVKMEKRNQLLQALKDDLFYDENEYAMSPVENRKYWRMKAIERLKKFGFAVPSDEEQQYSAFDEVWEDFLSRVIAVIECESENEEGNLNLWEKILTDVIPF